MTDLVDYHDYEFIGDFESAWNYYRNLLSNTENPIPESQPQYIETKNNTKYYGVKIRSNSDRKESSKGYNCPD
jgi:hypothetical protein